MYISKVSIKNYRNYKDFNIELKPFTILIGENNIGKSNLLEAMFLVLSHDISVYRKNNTLKSYSKFVHESNITGIKEYDLSQIIDSFVAASGLSRRELIETYEFSKLQLRRIAVGTRIALEKKDISYEDSPQFCKDLASDLYGKNIFFKLDTTPDEKGKKIVYGFEPSDGNDEVIKGDGIQCLSIHKSKGLEADAVLVIAQNEKEFLKWLNMTKSNMKSDTDEDYRLGYVAFTRARKVLLIACSDKVDISNIKKSVNIVAV